MGLSTIVTTLDTTRPRAIQQWSSIILLRLINTSVLNENELPINALVKITAQAINYVSSSRLIFWAAIAERKVFLGKAYLATIPLSKIVSRSNIVPSKPIPLARPTFLTEYFAINNASSPWYSTFFGKCYLESASCPTQAKSDQPARLLWRLLRVAIRTRHNGAWDSRPSAGALRRGGLTGSVQLSS